MKIGLITYHSAYNFGSVLQAYATQESIKKIVGNCEIINYRTNEQKRVYSVFRWNKGIGIIKSLAKNVLMIPHYKKQRNRQEKYENLFNNIFNLSEICIEPEEVYNLWNKYDIIVSGSDQIWNKNSNELKYVPYKYMYPYLLHNYNGKKVSYASSIVNMKPDEIYPIVDDIGKFDYISFREKDTCKKIKEIYNINSTNVLDPTFLLNKDEWIERFNIANLNKKDYILYYSLNNFKEIKSAINKLIILGKKKNLKVKIITPLNIVKKKKNIELIEDINPIEFLELIYNAKTIITDSYHGTILAVNFEKDVYSICKNTASDYRKIDILSRINLKDRIIKDIDSIINNEYEEINYDNVKRKIYELKDLSIKYLKHTLVGDNNE